MFIIIGFIIILGLLIGSFLNVCIYRIPRGESIAFPPSHCTNCDNKIMWYDLIPVLSYIFLRGKCRHCKEKISIRYPIIELITGVLFGALYIEYGLGFSLIKFLVLVCLIIVIGMIDLDTTDIYLSTTLTGIIIGCVFIAFNWYTGSEVLTYVYGGLIGGGVIAAIILLTHGMGWGDFELCLLIGLYLGFKLTIVMLFFSFIIGGLMGVLLIAAKKKTRKDYIPFGPSIALSCIFVMLFGEKILSLYLSSFH